MATPREAIVKSEICESMVGHGASLCPELVAVVLRNPCPVSSANTSSLAENIPLTLISSIQAPNNYRLPSETMCLVKGHLNKTSEYNNAFPATLLLCSSGWSGRSWNSKSMLSFLCARLWSSWMRRCVDVMPLSRTLWVLLYRLVPSILWHGRASVEVGLYVCLPKGGIIMD